MEPEINLLDYWRILRKRKRLVAVTVFLVTAAAVVGSLVYPVSYQAKASLMPLTSQKTGVLAGLMGGQGGLSLLSGLGSGGTTVASQIQAVLGSRTLAEGVIKKCQLLPIIYSDAWDPQSKAWKTDPSGKSLEPTIDDAVDNLLKMMDFDEDRKTFLIIITATMKDPALVANVVDCYLNELGTNIQKNTFTTAKKSRIFIEEQLEKNKAQLLEAGKGISGFYATNKISNVSPLVDVDVSQEADESIEGLQKKADELDRKIAEASVVRDVPEQVYLQYLTLRRQLLGQVNTLLTQQYEMAKIDEAREEPNFQIVDRPRPPLHRFRPKKKQMVIVGFALALFSGVMIALFRDYLDRLRSKEVRA